MNEPFVYMDDVDIAQDIDRGEEISREVHDEEDDGPEFIE
jgi:hypothetical protein